MLKTVSIIAVIAAASALTPVSAGEVRFHYAGHELSSAQSIDALYNRINNRAEAACVSRDLRELWRRAAEAQCVSLVVDDLVAGVGDSRLAAIHSSARVNRRVAENH